MQRKTIKTAVTLITGILIGAFAVGTLQAQQAGIKRNMLQKHELSAPGREAAMAHAEIPAGMEAGKHKHDGEELGYVQEGELVLEVEGKPAQTLKAGDSYFIEAGRAHNAKAVGSTPAKVLAIYIVEKGKPLATPVQ